MTDHFPHGEYGPELVALMGRALDRAWAAVRTKIVDTELARLVLASAIIDKVDAGVREHDDLVGAAISALTATSRLSGVDLGALERNWRSPS